MRCTLVKKNVLEICYDYIIGRKKQLGFLGWVMCPGCIVR